MRRLTISFGFLSLLLLAFPVLAQNYEFKANFGGACTIGVVTPATPSPYPLTDVPYGSLVPHGTTVAKSEKLGVGTGDFTQYNVGTANTGVFAIKHGRFKFIFGEVTLEGHYIGGSAPFDPDFASTGVFVGEMGGQCIVTKIVADKNACEAPDNLAYVCGTGKWTGTVQVLLPQDAPPSCLLDIEFRSTAGMR